MNGGSCGGALTTNRFYYNVLFLHCNHLHFAIFLIKAASAAGVRGFGGLKKNSQAQFWLTVTPLISRSDAYVRLDANLSAFQVFYLFIYREYVMEN